MPEYAAWPNRGRSTLANGALLQAAEGAAFEIMSTTDPQLQYQQNLPTRRIAAIVLTTTSWPRIRAASARVVHAVTAMLRLRRVLVEIP